MDALSLTFIIGLSLRVLAPLAMVFLLSALLRRLVHEPPLRR
jgi:hypothetical protein